MSERIVVVMRPGLDADRLRELETEAGRLRAEGHEVELTETAAPGDGARLAREASESGAGVVVAAGGDGTLNEVVNGLGAASRRARLAVVPLGTANDFAGGLGVPESPAAALRLAVHGRARETDLARCNDRWFINVSTGGFGAEATEQAPSESKKLLGPWAYVVKGARQFTDLRAVRARFETETGVLHDGEFLLFAVGNGKRTGGGSMLTPRAELDDGLLDVTVVKAVPRVDFLTLLPDLRAGTHLESPDIRYDRVASLTVRTAEPVTVNVDGEPTRGEVFEYSVERGALEVMEPLAD